MEIACQYLTGQKTQNPHNMLDAANIVRHD